MVLHPNFLYWSDKAIVFPREEHIMTVSMQLTRSRWKNFQTIPLSISLFFVFFSIHIQKMFLFFTFFVLFFLLFLQWRRWWKEKTSHYSPRYSGLCGENDRSLDWEFWWKMVIWFTFVAIKSVVSFHKAFCTLCLDFKKNKFLFELQAVLAVTNSSHCDSRVSQIWRVRKQSMCIIICFLRS